MGKDDDEKQLEKRGPLFKPDEPGGKAGVYFYRRRIPADIRRILREQDSDDDAGFIKGDKREEKKLLGRDKLRADAAWREFDKEVEARWAQLRKGSFGDLTAVQREALAGEVYRLWLKRYPPDSPHGGYEAARALEKLQEMDEEIPTDNWEMIHLMQRLCVDDVLAARGLIIHPSKCWPLVVAAQRAAQHACRFALQRSKGDVRPDPEAERYPAWPDPATTTLVGLHQKWVQNRQPNAETQRAFRASIDKLVAFVGFDDVTRLTTADVRRWCASMKEVAKKEGPKEEGSKEVGSKKKRAIGDIRIRDGYLAAVKAVLNSAVALGHVERNVAATVKVDVKGNGKRREKGLRDSEISEILRATLGPFPDHPGEHVHNARRWVPWLLLYTGARVSEMTRLESRHIVRQDGIDVVRIEMSKTGRSRDVPLHEDLRDQGFLDFVASRRGQPLFFDRSMLKDHRTLTIHRTRAEGIAAWIRTLEGMKITKDQDPRDRVAPCHGFRHRWRTECRRLFMDREVRNYLQGHHIENVGEGYGDVPPDVSAPWIAMFPTFDVSGPELKVQRRYDLSLLRQAAARMRAYEDARTAAAGLAVFAA